MGYFDTWPAKPAPEEDLNAYGDLAWAGREYRHLVGDDGIIELPHCPLQFCLLEDRPADDSDIPF